NEHVLERTLVDGNVYCCNVNNSIGYFGSCTVVKNSMVNIVNIGFFRNNKR
ncbi:9281_t:CDS:1, partial [Dentiscutata heterogama]